MEADVLRWSLLVIGSVVIVGLAVHGIWVSRKNNENKSGSAQKLKRTQQFEAAPKHSLPEYAEDDIDDQPVFSVNDDTVVDEQEINFSLDESVVTEASSKEVQDSDIKADFDDLGLGAVRVVSSADNSTAKASVDAPEDQDSQKTNVTDAEPMVKKSDSKIYASVVTQPKPEYTAKYQSLAAETVAISQQEKVNSAKSQVVSKTSSAEFTGNVANNGHSYVANTQYHAPEPPPFLLKKQAAEAPIDAATPSMADTARQNEHAPAVASEVQSATHVPLAEKLSLGEQARNLVKRKKSESLKKRQEPKMAEEQMRIDFDDAPAPKPEVEAAPNAKQVKPQAESQPQQEVLVLNVKVADDQSIAGAALLPMLLTLGFKFGEQDIFHRHVNSSGKGPVLFSLANMFKPGNFDIDNLENFTTQGISLFMILPIEGEPHQVFNMMHNAARKIADEFSGQIYDGRRALLTKQSLQQYVEKIREFERQRMLNRQ